MAEGEDVPATVPGLDAASLAGQPLNFLIEGLGKLPCASGDNSAHHFHTNPCISVGAWEVNGQYIIIPNQWILKNSFYGYTVLPA